MWLVLVLVCCSCAKKQLQRPRVYLGQEDISNQFPYVVSIEYEDGIRQCTSSLIARNWILTAGHCVEFDTPIFIRYTNFTLQAKQAKAYTRVIKFFRHPGYFDNEGDGTLENDLALALIEEVPKTSRIGKLSAVDYKALLGLPVQYAGFGYTTKGEEAYIESDEFKPLQTGEAVVITCEPERPMIGPSICVAPKCSNKFQSTRPGDSGGPLVHEGKIVGVLMSVTNGYIPISKYAAVSPNLAWIMGVMKRNE